MELFLFLINLIEKFLILYSFRKLHHFCYNFLVSEILSLSLQKPLIRILKFHGVGIVWSKQQFSIKNRDFMHGRSQDFFRGRNTFSKIFPKIFKKFCKLFWKFWENFRKYRTAFLRQLLKMHYFSIFFKKLKPCVNFLRVWTTIANRGKCWENF